MSDVFDSKAFLKTVTSQPGVYRMYDAGGTVIYVGKAKDLKKRLSSYFRSNLASRKTEALVALIAQIDVTVTHTETEALLLEHNMRKANILARSPTATRFARRWRCCKKSSLSASVRTASIATVRGLACSIKLAAVWGRASPDW